MIDKFDPQQFGKVAVLMGGQNAEREVSLMSGQGVVDALKKHHIDVQAIDVGDDVYQQLVQAKLDRAFIALHGSFGEDGVIQGALETLKIPYTGSSVCASAIAMDKIITKLVWRGLALPTSDFVVLNQTTDAKQVIKQLGLPLAIKPVCQGSSLGVTKVTELAEFKKALALAHNYGCRVMAEPWLQGREFTVGILGNQALPIIHIATPVGFYDYEAKYYSDDTQFNIPCGLSAEAEKTTQELAFKAYQALGCRHWGRVDLMEDEKGKLWLLEVNTIPGLTSHSLVPQAARACGIEYDELIVRILQQTLTTNYK